MILSWLGGKAQLAPQIISLMPEHDTYIEPFFGGGWVFWLKQPAQYSVINDVNNYLINMYQTIRDNPEEFTTLLEETLFARQQWEDFMLALNNGSLKNQKLMSAVAYYYLIKTSFASKGDYFVPRRDSVIVFVNDEIKNNIKIMSRKLKNTLVENQDYTEILHRYQDAGKGTFIYLDPPYVDTQSKHENTFEFQDHINLSNWLKKLKCNWMLSYNESLIIRDLYKDFNILTKDIFYSVGTMNKVRNEKIDSIFTELIITNYNPQESLPLFNGA